MKFLLHMNGDMFSSNMFMKVPFHPHQSSSTGSLPAFNQMLVQGWGFLAGLQALGDM